MLKGYKTIITGLALVIIPPAISFLSAIDWTQYVSPNVALIISGVLMLGLRLVTTTPVGQSNTTAAKIAALFLIVAGCSIFIVGIASAAPLKLHVTGNPVTDIKADVTDANGNRIDTNTNPENAIIARAQQLGTKLIADLNTAHDLAAYTDKNGAQADAAGASCYAALIPVVTLVVNGPPSATPDAPPPTAGTGVAPTVSANLEQQEPGAVTKIEKLRIIRIALQSTALKNSCAALVQDVQSQMNSVITGAAGIARIITGLGIGLP